MDSTICFMSAPPPKKRLSSKLPQRKQAEEALRTSEVKYRRLFEPAQDGILILDAKTGQIKEVNPFLMDMLGYSHKEFLRKKLWEIGSFEDVKAANAIFKELQEKGYVRYENLPLNTKDGRDIDVEFISNAYKIGGKNVIQCDIRDITERKRAEKKLKQAMIDLARSNKELEQFAYVASHDLQEPLRMVASFMQLLSNRYKGKLDAEADEFIEYAVEGANKLQNMINDLLEYSRLGKRGKPFKPTDCESILEQTLVNLNVSIEANGATITHDALPTVCADESLLLQLFQNLISNALKFRGKDLPAIHISAKSKENEYVFSVHDNGIGIDPQYKDRIFIIFQRLHGREYQGTGIGLAVCKRIVERHGGRIWVESESGKGSTFFFTIPKEVKKYE